MLAFLSFSLVDDIVIYLELSLVILLTVISGISRACRAWAHANMSKSQREHVVLV